MLTVDQKATILARTGSAVPPFPGFPDLRQTLAVKQWMHEIEVLYSCYAAARAAKGLREAEAARQLDMLRQATARWS